MKKFLFLLMAGTMLCGGAYAKHDCDCSDCRAKMERKMRQQSLLHHVSELLGC